MTSSHASTLVKDLEDISAQTIQDPSVLRLYCKTDEGEYYRSKLAVLNSQSSKYDFAVTTAHGIVGASGRESRKCFVQNLNGKQIDVQNYYTAENYAPGTSTDWALLKFKKVHRSELTRFSFVESEADALLPNDALFRFPVTFPKAIGIAFNHQHCMLLSSKIIGITDTKLRAHNCRAVPGQSGSPVSIGSDKRPLLLGIHLGKAFTYHSPVTRKPEHLGYFRLIDDDMKNQIEDAIKGMQ